MKNLSICLFVLGLAALGCDNKPATPTRPTPAPQTMPTAPAPAPDAAAAEKKEKDDAAAAEKKPE